MITSRKYIAKWETAWSWAMFTTGIWDLCRVYCRYLRRPMFSIGIWDLYHVYYRYLRLVPCLTQVSETCPVFTTGTWDLSYVYHRYKRLVPCSLQVPETCPVFTTGTWYLSRVYHRYLGPVPYVFTTGNWDLSRVYHRYLRLVQCLPEVSETCPVFTTGAWDLSRVYHRCLRPVPCLPQVFETCSVFATGVWDLFRVYHRYLREAVSVSHETNVEDERELLFQLLRARSLLALPSIFRGGCTLPKDINVPVCWVPIPVSSTSLHKWVYSVKRHQRSSLLGACSCI